ncbi:MAG TPA: DUF3696 domain-containing protein [Chloroflexota bacterium]|nr:DUF3696 domain-containing protein [Chloroflexota bacterium]
MLGTLLNGYFYVGAVRIPTVDVSPPPSELPFFRHVGEAGEDSWLLARRFGQKEMREGWPTRFESRDFVDRVHCLLWVCDDDVRRQDERLRRVWELAPVEQKAACERLCAQLRDVPEGPRDSFGYDVYPAQANEIAESLSGLLNSVLDRRDLFAPCWLTHVETVDLDGEVTQDQYFADDEIMHYCDKGIDRLSDREFARFNYLLVEEALFRSCWLVEPGYFLGYRYWLEDYLNYWMFKLTGADFGSARIERTKFPHVGFLLHPRLHGDESSDRDRRYRPRTSHPCFGDGAASHPRQMSAGFHQVLPIFVQLGLMRQGEILGVENPEVHLHPSAQLDITEALLDHAKTGRQVIVETHCDLVIRRVVRAILEETIAQSAVGIYFTDLDGQVTARTADHEILGPKGTNFQYSRLTPISVDGRGRISNWPDGFLGDDVRESQRLLDVMYGQGSKLDEDDDDDE